MVDIIKQRPNDLIPITSAREEMRIAYNYGKARMNAVHMVFSGAFLMFGGIMTPVLTLEMHSFKAGFSVIEWALKIIGFILAADGIYKHRELDSKS